jgi:DNA polymerase-3 subunit beta
MIDRSQFFEFCSSCCYFLNKTTHQIRLKIAGAELNVSAEDIDYSNKAEERLTLITKETTCK